MKREYDSCVFKRDWAHYKPCNECPTKCKDRYNWYQRIIETVMVWLYRRKIKRELQRTFLGTKLNKQQIRRLKRQIGRDLNKK